MLLPSGQVCPVEETNQMSRKTNSSSQPSKQNIYWVAHGKPSRGLRLVCLFYFFNFFFNFFVFFSVSVKVLPVTPLVSGVFVHRAFCSYFLKIERVVELHRFLWWTQ